MEEPTVEYRVEPLPERWQVEGVTDLEADGERASCSLLPGLSDGCRSRIDAGGLESHRGSHQGVLAGAAPDIEHAAPDLTGIRQADERALRSADVPGWGALVVEGVEVPGPGHAQASVVPHSVVIGHWVVITHWVVIGHLPLYHGSMEAGAGTASGVYPCRPGRVVEGTRTRVGDLELPPWNAPDRSASASAGATGGEKMCPCPWAQCISRSPSS